MMASQGSDKYSADNLRFRRAYIRERLLSLKAERDGLAAERERIDAMLNIKKADPSNDARPASGLAIVHAGRDLDAGTGSVPVQTRLKTFSVNGSARTI